MSAIIDAINHSPTLAITVGSQLCAIIGWLGGYFFGRIHGRRQGINLMARKYGINPNWANYFHDAKRPDRR